MRLHFLTTSAVLLVVLPMSSGCQLPALVGAMTQSAEYQKKVEVPPMYDDLAGYKTAVLVDVGMALLYDHPLLASQIGLGVASAIQRGVEGVQVINPEQTMRWQVGMSNWRLLGYDQIADTLDVERLVVIDIYEYRHNPPGNRYLWDGVCGAHVRIVETHEGAFDPSSPADEYDIVARFPDKEGFTQFDAAPQQIEAGLITKFIQQTAWLFYTHIEPKYPDRYRPELDASPIN